MSRPMRQKIISYQSDMGYQLLTRQVQGLIKLGMTMNSAERRLAFAGIKRKVQEVERIGVKS